MDGEKLLFSPKSFRRGHAAALIFLFSFFLLGAAVAAVNLYVFWVGKKYVVVPEQLREAQAAAISPGVKSVMP